MPSGLVVVDKPAGWTSHDVVGRLRKLARTRRVGHAGTLDPMATGVLVVGVDAGTRLLHHLVLAGKTYTATIRLGRSTVTDDAEGAQLGGASAAPLQPAAVEAAMSGLTGDIEQAPSAVSAIKIDGRGLRPGAGRRAGGAPRAAGDRARVPGPRVHPAHGRAARRRRRGRVLVGHLRARPGRDLGAGLGVGGHLTALRRTRVGPFEIGVARTLDQLAELDDPVTLPLAAALRAAFPVREIDAEEARELSFGRPITARGVVGVHAAIDAAGLAVALLREDEGRARPVLVFAPAG